MASQRLRGHAQHVAQRCLESERHSPDNNIGIQRGLDIFANGMSSPSIFDTTQIIEPGSPWENGYIESFNGKLRDELLNREIFTTLTEVKVLIADWRKEYNQVRPHSSLGYRPPAPQAKMPVTLTL